MGSAFVESLQRRRESQTQEPLGQALARELLSLENVAYLMANGERNGLPVAPNQLIYQEKAVAVGDETLSVPTLILYSQDEQSDTLTPLITYHLLVTPEGAMELAHIVVTQSTLTDTCETLPRMRKKDERVPISQLDIDFERDTVVYRARLSTQVRSIIPITSINGASMKAFSQKDPMRAVSVVTLNMETDEWVVRKSHQTLFHGKQIQERGTGLYALGDEISPGVLRQILTQFTDAERRLLQEEGRRLSTSIPRRRTVRLSQTP